MSGIRNIGLVARLSADWHTVQSYAARRGIRYGTVKRWVAEGLPVLRSYLHGKSTPIVRVLPTLADAWIARHYPDTIAHDRESVVYFARRLSDGAIKIGFTSDVARRMVELRKKHGGAHELISTRAGDKPDELKLHERFAAHRIGETEWFHPVPEILEEANATLGNQGGLRVTRLRSDQGAEGDAGARRLSGQRRAPEGSRGEARGAR